MRNASNTSRPHWRPVGALGRRQAIAALACLAGTVPWRAAFGQRPGECVLTPESGEGPFYFDPRLVRTDITENEPGAPLDLAVQVVRAGDCAVLTDARVDLWHADAVGLYSGYERQRGTGGSAKSPVGRTYLRGTQFTDDSGSVAFHTVYPSWYVGRTPHVHFKVFLEDSEVVASQIFFPEDFNNQVFDEFAPYRQLRARRDTFNDGDTFLTGRTGGVFCDVERRAAGYLANVVIAVRSRV